MPATNVRIRNDETLHQLRELQRLTGVGPTEVVARAIDSFRRSLILADTNLAYQALRDDDTAWAEEAADRAEWDRALQDGLPGDD